MEQLQDLAIVLGHYSLFLAFAAAAWAVVASLLGVVTRGLGLQFSAERSLWVTFGFTLLASLCLVSGFVTNDFRLDYVYSYSNTSQALQYKIGALWGGQAGSLLLWLLILTVMTVILLATNRRKNRALMPWITVVVGGTIVFFLILLNFIEPPFTTGPLRPDGVGLNPQLKSYWMMIHPPTLYVGYVSFTIPFAFAIAALLTRRSGDLWFRTTRRWTIFGWFVLGTGILLGAYWAYVELGWGGYWAWDPVENASLMPWLAATAFLHSVMIQEKKGMLKIWNVMLIIMTFSLCIFGTFLTRSGIISSVHSFATSDIAAPFAWFLALVFFGSLALLIMRMDGLRSEARLESVLSRESSFLFNNMILVGMAGTVLLLTIFPILSEHFTGRKVTMGPPIFNLVNVPWALVLLLLTGIGPLIAWRKATPANLKRNFVFPTLTGLWFFILIGFILVGRDAGAFTSALAGMGDALLRFNVADFLGQLKVFYPLLTFGAAAFVVAALLLEVYRGVRVRKSRHGELLPVALGRLIWRNKRRYGGYIVHVGIVLIFIGIAASSAYQQEVVAEVNPGEYIGISDYTLRYERFSVNAVDDHLGAVMTIEVFDARTGRRLGSVEPERRLHPNMLAPELRQAFLQTKQLGAAGDPRYGEAVLSTYRMIPVLERQYGREVQVPSTEVGVFMSLSPSHLGEDLYVIPLFVDPRTGQARIRVFVNPMVNFIWFGGLVFILGSVIAICPDARERRRLQVALALEERSVA